MQRRNFRTLNQVLIGFKGLQSWNGDGFKTTEFRSRLNTWSCPGVSNEGIHDKQKYTTCIAILILDVGTRLKQVVRFTPRPPYLQGKKVPDTHRKRRWVGPQSRSGLSRKDKDLWPHAWGTVIHTHAHASTHAYTLYIYIYIYIYI